MINNIDDLMILDLQTQLDDIETQNDNWFIDIYYKIDIRINNYNKIYQPNPILPERLFPSFRARDFPNATDLAGSLRRVAGFFQRQKNDDKTREWHQRQYPASSSMWIFWNLDTKEINITKIHIIPLNIIFHIATQTGVWILKICNVVIRCSIKQHPPRPGPGIRPNPWRTLEANDWNDWRHQGHDQSSRRSHVPLFHEKKKG